MSIEMFEVTINSLVPVKERRESTFQKKAKKKVLSRFCNYKIHIITLMQKFPQITNIRTTFVSVSKILLQVLRLSEN